jgi:hypothetical protein
VIAAKAENEIERMDSDGSDGRGNGLKSYVLYGRANWIVIYFPAIGAEGRGCDRKGREVIGLSQLAVCI